MNTKPILVFDFDGTISDSVEAMFESVNDLSKILGFRKIKNEEYASFRKMSTEEIIKELGIPKDLIPRIIDGIHKGLKKRANSLKPVDGMVDTLKFLAKNGYPMYIVTSNTKANVESFIKKFKIYYFSGIYPEGGYYGKSNLINKFIKDLGAGKDSVVFIGDEVRDIEAGKECKIKTAAVTWGLNGKKALNKKHPDWLIDTPKQLMNIFI